MPDHQNLPPSERVTVDMLLRQLTARDQELADLMRKNRSLEANKHSALTLYRALETKNDGLKATIDAQKQIIDDLRAVAPQRVPKFDADQIRAALNDVSRIAPAGPRETPPAPVFDDCIDLTGSERLAMAIFILFLIGGFCYVVARYWGA